MVTAQNSNAVVTVVWNGETIGPLVTNAADRLRYETVAPRQGWLPLGKDPHFSTQIWAAFMGWAAAKRLGKLPADLSWEKFSAEVEDIDVSDTTDDVGPTNGEPGTGP